MTVDLHAAATQKSREGIPGQEPLRKRQNWMAVLAKSDPKDLAEKTATLRDLPRYAVIRPAETGSVMVRGRAGGTGSPFNLGEMTVTRCVVQLTGSDDNSVVGHAYVAGRDKGHAENAALMDALLQTSSWHSEVRDNVITPLAQAAKDARLERSGKVAATKVNFFTMVRGEN
ncbi:phosphonate C-P lyase system protein PhnG [Hwanghaeella sp.]|uniref:phosphonate C-P lyase system protein PhnG n=1 Tax=Hwanghaeella sp. TaxID=2605943 RepID=UPI003CCC35CA